ncbi:MAG: hypothetical protein ACLUSX_11685 [Ruminococcus sp.]
MASPKSIFRRSFGSTRLTACSSSAASCTVAENSVSVSRFSSCAIFAGM